MTGLIKTTTNPVPHKIRRDPRVVWIEYSAAAPGSRILSYCEPLIVITPNQGFDRTFLASAVRGQGPASDGTTATR